MLDKRVATIDIVKALAGVSLTTFAAVGSATGNLLFAGLSAIPAATLVAYDTLRSSDTERNLKAQDTFLKLPVPKWWDMPFEDWEGLCQDIIAHLPDILSTMEQQLLKEQEQHNTITRQVIIRIFKGSFEEIFPWLSDRQKIATSIAAPTINKLNAILKPLIEEMQHESMLEDIHDIKNALNPPKLDTTEIATLSQQYCKKLYEHNAMLDFKGIQHADKNRSVIIPLIEVFVLPDVLIGIPEYETLERDEIGESKTSKKKTPEQNNENKQDQDDRGVSRRPRVKQIVLQREPLHTVLANQRRLVILGDPGSGKSTLLKYLMLTLSGKKSLFSQEFPQLLIDVQYTLPLYIPLSTYAEEWHREGLAERSLEDFLHKYLRINYLHSFTTVVLEQLHQGNLLLLLDGLDEIPDATLRMQIVKQIETFTTSYPLNHFIVTSRIVGYKDASLATDYKAYTLADFSEEQIKIFTKKWCPAYEQWVNQITDSDLLQKAATKEAEQLFHATRANEGVKRLAVNPLLLTILALIQRQGITLPSHRVELYDLCIDTLLETWIRTKGLTTAIPYSKSELIKILRPLAFWMHEQHAVLGAVREEEILEQITRQLLERRVANSEDDAQQRAEQFLQTVRDKTGILIERGWQQYGFLHLTFEEYLSALELVARKDKILFIRSHLHDPHWQVVILLAVGIIGILRSEENAVTEIIEEGILEAQSPSEHWLHRDLLLAGRCLADDIGLSIVLEEKIIEKIISIYLTSPYALLRTTASEVLGSWKGTNVAEKAATIVVNLMNRLPNIVSLVENFMASPPISEDNIYKSFSAFYLRLAYQNQKSYLSFFYLNLYMLLHRLNEGTLAEKIKYATKSITGSDWQVRQAAATALGQLGQGQPQVLDALLQALSSDSDPDVRQAAATALGQLGQGQPRVLDALLQALSSNNLDLRIAIFNALTILHPDNISLVQILEKILKDYEQTTDEQFTSDEPINKIISLLQEIVGQE